MGRLHAQDRSVLEALRDLGLPLATTNYDGLLEEVTGYPPITWRSGDRIKRVLQGDEPGILHLHGYWNEPESVVLGIRSYERILGHEHAQAVLRAVQALKTCIFIGCGEGLDDPNFGAPRMTPTARRLLSVMALLPDGVAHEDLDALMPEEMDEAVPVLRKVGLAFDQAGRLRVLAPVREYVRAKHEPDAEDLNRAVDYYLGIAGKGDQVGWPGGAEAARKLVQELGNLDGMISRGLERTDPEPAILAACGLGKFVWLSGWGSRDPLDKALAVARKNNGQGLEARCLERMGEIALARSDHDAARGSFKEALRHYERILDPYSIGWAKVRLARLEPVGSLERRSLVQAAREAWESIKRPDLVERLKAFGDDFEPRRRGAGGPRGKKRRG